MDKKKKIIVSGAAGAAALVLAIVSVTTLKNDKETVPTVTDTTTAVTTTEPVGLPAGWENDIAYSPEVSGLSGRARSLLRLNPDICGWIRIHGTQVDYPITKDPGEISKDNKFYGGEDFKPNWFYLDHDLDRSYKESGTIYMDYRDDFGSDESKQSENLLLYGHDMLNGSMMGSLRNYRLDYDFYNGSPFIELSSNYRDYDYVIFAFLVTSGSYNDTDFHYWNMEELDDKETFDGYVEHCVKNCPLDMGIDVQYGDKLVTLSTCYGAEGNYRFIVVGRRLREGEVAGDLSSVKHTEEYIKAHQPETTEASADASATSTEAAAQ